MNRDQALGHAIKALTACVDGTKHLTEDYQANLDSAAKWAQIVVALKAVSG